jgi:hypothetical protein
MIFRLVSVCIPILLSACALGPRGHSTEKPVAEFPQPTLRIHLPSPLSKRSLRAYLYKGSAEIAHALSASGDLLVWVDSGTQLILHPGIGQYRVAIWIANPSGKFQGPDSFGAMRTIEVSASTELELLAKDLAPLKAAPIVVSGGDHATCEWLPAGQELGPSEPFLQSDFGLLPIPYDLICWTGASLLTARRIGVKRHIVPNESKIRIKLTQAPLRTFYLDGTTEIGNAWQFGFSATPSLKADAFRPSTYVDKREALQMWHPAAGNDGYYPYVALNTLPETVEVFKGVIVRPMQVAMEGANDGRFSLVRFVAPATGVYWLQTQVEGIHVGPSTTDVHILLADHPLFDAWIEGYGGDPKFHAVVGVSPTARYATLLDLHKGDIVTFALGYGFNRTHFGDTSGITPQLRFIHTSYE